MALGCNINGRTVRFDDLTPAAWMAIGADGEWAEVYVAPLRDLNAALRLVAECVRVAEPDCADVDTRASELGSTYGKLKALIVDVPDDQPTEFVDGIPKEAAGSSTDS